MENKTNTANAEFKNSCQECPKGLILMGRAMGKTNSDIVCIHGFKWIEGSESK